MMEQQNNPDIGFTPQNPASQMVSGQTYEVPGGRKRNKYLIISLIALFVVGAGGATAYWFGFLGTTSLEKSLTKLTEIESASYDFTISIYTEDRDEDAKPFDEEIFSLQGLEVLYQNDENRFRDLREIRNALELSYTKDGKYPLSLNILAERGYLKAVPEYTYRQTKSGGGYELVIIFETIEAIDAVEGNEYGLDDNVKPPEVSRQTVTFTEESYDYYYFSGRSNVPVFLSLLGDESILQYIPVDAEILAGISGSADRDEEDAVTAKLGFVADVDLGDLIWNVDVEFITKDDIFYGRINRFPNLFFDLAKVKKRWVKIEKDELSGYGILSYAARENKEEIEEGNSPLEQVKLLLEIADQEGIIETAGVSRRERINGRSIVFYEISLDKNELPDFYRDASERFEDEFGEDSIIKFEESTVRYLESDLFGEIFDYVKKNTVFEIGVDSRSGFPTHFSYKFRFVPSDKTVRLEGKQVILEAVLSLRDVNKKIEIEEPDEFMTFEEAQIALLGRSATGLVTQAQSSQVISDVSTLKSALSLYNAQNGFYPGDLEELADGDPEDVLSKIPTHPNGDEYIYKRVGGGFEIIYYIELPKYTEGIRPASYARSYVDGRNTATESLNSREWEAASKIDTDGDGLADYYEDYLGTDKNNSDFDGDGYSDGDEVDGGYNPFGPGKLEYESSYSPL